MRVSAVNPFSKRKNADLLVLPFWENKQPYSALHLDSSLKEAVKEPIELGDFKAKEGEICIVYIDKQKESRLMLLGLGPQEKANAEVLRRSYSSATRYCHKKKWIKANFCTPASKGLSIKENEVVNAIAEGIFLTNYKWDQLKSRPESSLSLLEEVNFVGISSSFEPILEQAQIVAEKVFLARDLINGNADDVTPQFLALMAQKISKEHPKVKTTILDKKQIEKEGMGLLLAVGRGAVHPPVFIVMSYKGNSRSKDHTVLVGKGITFDTGGLNLKPTGSMETMRDDMSGAAAVMGAMAAVAALELKVNVSCVIAAAENAIDSLSFKPGDVYKSFSGKTVEIGNTDAEGRLTLADALTYSVKRLSATRIIDLATLTGAMVVALGEGMSGIMSNNEQLTDKLMAASESTSEILWPLPLHAPYKELLKSDVADIKNIGGRPGGSILAGLFLQEFVENIPWAHIDIAGTAFGTKERHYLPKNGVGFGVRLLVEFLKNL